MLSFKIYSGGRELEREEQIENKSSHFFSLTSQMSSTLGGADQSQETGTPPRCSMWMAVTQAPAVTPLSPSVPVSTRPNQGPEWGVQPRFSNLDADIFVTIEAINLNAHH